MNKFASLKKFEKEFPKAAREAKYGLGADIFYHDKAFWLDSSIQLTGYQLGDNGKAMSQDDNETIAIKRIKEFKEGKAALEKESLVTRFVRLINEAEQLKPKWKHFTSYRHTGGDKATVLDDGDVWITFIGIDYQLSATGKKNRKESIDECIRQFEAYTGAKIV
jgi:hypothetical protein